MPFPFKLSPEVRKKIIEKLLTTPKRKALMKEAGPAIEEIVQHPSVRRAYIGGSFASKKLNPSDVDLIVRHAEEYGTKEGEDFFTKFQPYLADPIVGGGGKSSTHIAESWPEDLRSEGLINFRLSGMKGEMAEARKRYGKDYKWTRIAGLTGALAGGSMAASTLEPEEAEAGTIGKAFKLGKEVFKGVSRTAEGLSGTKFLGKEIKTVMKGRGDTRYIVLTDDTVYPTNKNVISDMIRTSGTAEKLTEFAAKKKGPGIDQALKSMAYHESRTNQYNTRAIIRDYYKAYTKQMKEAGVDVMPFSLVQRGDLTYTMPTPYAKMLEKEGHLKVIEELK